MGKLSVVKFVQYTEMLEILYRFKKFDLFTAVCVDFFIQYLMEKFISLSNERGRAVMANDS